MKLPRDVSGADPVKALRGLGYAVDRQKGSHLRGTTQQGGEHHEVIPNHHPSKISPRGDAGDVGPFGFHDRCFWREGKPLSRR